MGKTAKLLKRDQAFKRDIDYWKTKSPEEKLTVLQELREQHIQLFHKQEKYHEARKGLRRVHRIIKRS